jgi:serine/threonine-protein kinase
LTPRFPREGNRTTTITVPPDGLGGRYVLDREIGRGGMATVYLAYDSREQRQVAVKIMHSRLTHGLDGRRFLREIEIAASLSHPRIVPLYDSGQAGDVLYYVMPFVDGESLLERLDRERQLPLEEVLAIAADVAEALGYAHRQGILHRDVKPENVLLMDGRALVVDFGLARAIGEANYRRLTETGVLVGTAFYMSPEQILAKRDLDERSDIYSLGCIVYEMLTGDRPFTASSPMGVIYRHAHAPRPRLSRALTHFQPLLDRLLAVDRLERFQSAGELLAALDEQVPRR